MPGRIQKKPGRGGGGLRAMVRGTVPPALAASLARSHHGRRPPHLCNAPKVERVGRGTYVADIASLTLALDVRRCRHENSTLVARGYAR